MTLQGMREDRAQFLAGFFKDFFGVGLLSHPVSDELHRVGRAAQALQASLQRHDRLRAHRSRAPTSDGDLEAFTCAHAHHPRHAGQDGADRRRRPRRARGHRPGSTLIEYDGAPHGLFATHKTPAERGPARVRAAVNPPWWRTPAGRRWHADRRRRTDLTGACTWTSTHASSASSSTARATAPTSPSGQGRASGAGNAGRRHHQLVRRRLARLGGHAAGRLPAPRAASAASNCWARRPERVTHVDTPRHGFGARFDRLLIGRKAARRRVRCHCRLPPRPCPTRS
jgi:hypothetical protein